MQFVQYYGLYPKNYGEGDGISSAERGLSRGGSGNQARADTGIFQRGGDDSRLRARCDENFAYAATQGFHSGLELGLHAPRGHAVEDELLGSGTSQSGTNFSLAIADSIDVGEKNQLRDSKRNGARYGHLIGIHIVNIAAFVSCNTSHHREVVLAS